VHHTTHIVSPGHQFVVEEHATAHDRLFTAGHRSARACLHPSSRCCHRCVTGGVSSCLVRSSRDASKVTPSAKCRSRTLHFMGGSVVSVISGVIIEASYRQGLGPIQLAPAEVSGVPSPPGACQHHVECDEGPGLRGSLATKVSGAIHLAEVGFLSRVRTHPSNAGTALCPAQLPLRVTDLLEALSVSRQQHG